jgi:predicted O-methyltransferase YrrM
MIENFSWFTNKKNNFREYVLGLPNSEVEEILGAIPSAWNYPPKSHREFAEWLIKTLKPKVTVELGVDYGYSSFVMSMCQENPVFGIDCFDISKHGIRVDDDYEFVIAVKEKLGIKNLTIIKDYFDSVAKTWNKSIDLLHIDGLHDYDNCKNDFETWLPFMSNNGVIIMHDTISAPDGVGRFFKEINLPKVNFKNSFGLGVVAKNKTLIEQIEKQFYDWV